MFKTHKKEQHNGHPHSDHFTADIGRNHGADNTHRNHPVTQHAADKNGKPAGCTVLSVTQGTGFTDMSHFFRNGAAIGVVAVGENKRHQKGNG